MDALMENLIREVERLERAYKLLPCEELEERLHAARIRLKTEQVRRMMRQ